MTNANQMYKQSGSTLSFKEWNKMMTPTKQKTSWWCCF